MKAYFIFPLTLALLWPLIATAQGTLAPGFYDDTVPTLLFTNPNAVSGQAGFYSGPYNQATNLEFWFESDGFTVYGQRDSLTPVVEICIDDICDTLDLNSVSPYIGELFTISGLSVGTHHVFITANPEPINYDFDVSVYFDAVEIHALAQPTPQPSSTPMPTETPNPAIYSYTIETEAGSQAVQFEYVVSTGDVLVASGLYALVVLGAVSLAVLLWKQ